MKKCPQCGFRLTDVEERCLRCGAYLDTISRPDPLDLPRERFKFSGGEAPRWHWKLPGQILAFFRRRAYFIRRALESELPTDVHYRDPWVAGLLSIVPGLGQFYNHQRKKGMLIFLFVACYFALALATIHHPFSNYVLLSHLMALIYSFHDALVTAKRINRDLSPLAARGRLLLRLDPLHLPVLHPVSICRLPLPGPVPLDPL